MKEDATSTEAAKEECPEGLTEEECAKAMEEKAKAAEEAAEKKTGGSG